MEQSIRRAALFILFSCTLLESATAQERRVTLRTDYPLAIGDTFLSKYDGVLGLGLTFDQPIAARWLIRPSLEYERLKRVRASTITAHEYSARLGIGYLVSLSRSVSMIPEVSAGYTRMTFKFSGNVLADPIDGQDGFSTWVALNPRYTASRNISFGVSLGYKAVFLEERENAGVSGFYRQLHTLNFGITLAYEL